MAEEDDDKPFGEASRQAQEVGRQAREAGRQAREWARSFNLNSVGNTVNEWAKRARDLVVEVSENVGVPEAVRDATEQARALRVAGEAGQARTVLRELTGAYGDEPNLVNALALTATHERFIDDRVPGGIEILRELADRLDAKRVGAMALVDAAEALRHQQDPSACLDHLRRGKRNLERLSSQDLIEAQLLAHLLAASAHRRLGQHERAIREIRKAAAALPPGAGDGLRRLTLALGVDQLLADGRVSEAERWVQTAYHRRITDARRQVVRERAAAAAEANQDAEPGVEPEEDMLTVDEAGTEFDGPRAGDELVDTSYTALETALLARVLAARGERSAAMELLTELPSGPSSEPGGGLVFEARVRVLIHVSPDASQACAEALRYLQLDAGDGERLRLWALAEFRRWREASRADDELSPPTAMLSSLAQALSSAPPHARPARSQELAHVALFVEDFSPSVTKALAAVRHELGDEAALTLGEELRLHWIRAALSEALSRAHEGRGADLVPADIKRQFSAGPPYHLSLRPELGEVLGPDELSPLRDPLRREALVAAQRELAVAERSMLDGPAGMDAAGRALVAALIQDPDLPAARRRLAALTRPQVGERLEDQLGAATELLAKLPVDILGATIHGGAEALRMVIAARERLARPLTIAIMGEFSAGKSTFVNALLGEAVAPMGVLPTTNTINVFRRGAGRGARVHYRDATISTVAAGELDAYLRNLDDREADRIRHLEIDRVGERMGDAAVVDTPGLNALDEYHETVAREFIEEADAVVWLFSATQGGTATEAGILAELREGGRKVLGVLNKVDTLDSEADRDELTTYLREQLGEVLVEVLPLSAAQALDYRTGASPDSGQGVDPFTVVDDALERHFLAHARELKAELIRRRLTEALGLARASVLAAVTELERRGAGEDPAAALERATRTLARFSEELHEGLLNLDDVLAREALSLGIVEAGAGLRRKLDEQDAEYLEATLEDAAMAALQTRIASLAGEHEVLANLLVERLVPWARGYLASSAARGFAQELINRHGRAASRGEQALRAAVRSGLRDLADHWRVNARSCFRELERALARARRSSTSAPRAEALRLRSSVLVALDGLVDQVSIEASSES
ncbi:putative atp /gtp binding protein [Plesiocystis pacifica SIR-1]|uniref:Putative atp /gtp binding protein n=1 Tax=Plesiocystis pacifica SIR-1 TaxID=391625 RepID=A6G5R3_9BACT|nr:dynamin family protein [Plesiocystis pacifica]EDM78844.1 putative atp /gtp binding protein [Plesiocystis pacifica SIR-1]